MSKQPKKSTIRNWLRRGLSGILSLALILALLPGAVLPGRAAHWAMPYAQKLVEWGVMRGDNGNLALDRPITRAEFVTMMNRAYGYKRLGAMPFPDVSTRDWYYEDINIAYNMGYFKGASGYALPRASLTREQAAVMLTRNMMVQENVGEGLQFSDSRALSEWSRGLVSAAADMGIIGGYADGSFRPKQNITRGEVASMLVKAIGTMVNTKGGHDLGSVYGNVTVNTAGVTLKNGTIAGNLYLTGGIDLGDVVLENVNVLGEIVVSGGGESHSSQSSVTLRNVTAKAMSVDSISGQFVTLRAEGITDIGTTTVRTNAYVDDSSLSGFGGLGLIVQDGGRLLQLAGNVKEVWNRTPNSELQVVQGSANKITMDEHATNSSVFVDGDARVNDLNLDVSTSVTGEGDIKNLNVGAAGTTVEQLPDDITIRPGITSDIKGTTMNSAQAAESSADPRLLAGYPKVKNVAPNSAELVFSTNKAGTVYWAVTAVADGSVGEADLIEPPAYGGNILKSGSVKMASSNTEVKAPTLSGLAQAGSYYVSTVFVDDRGIHSPVKVTAFTTPDGTVPAFSDGPRMSRITTAVAQVTGMPNKSCQLYYALLRKGATAPTGAELKANAVSGNLGYGVRDVVKNTNITINVNARQLDEQTDHVVYLWLTDYDGSKSSRVYSVPFKTPDERSPIITRTRPGSASENAIEMNVVVDEAATVFWTIIPEGGENEAAFEERGIDEGFNAEDPNLQIKIENGAGSYTKNGKKQVSAANANKEILIGQGETRPLDSAKTGTSSYWMYMVAKDAAGNYSKIEKVRVQTKDDIPPQLLRQDFEPAVTDGSGRPRADSNVKLVFSENVKGGTGDGSVFLRLYEAVEKAVRQRDVAAEEKARNALGQALYDHVTLYNGKTGAGRNDGEVAANYKVKAVTNAVTQEKHIENDYSGSDPWAINYCYAKVQLVNGSLTITFPTVKDDSGTILDTSALKLASGATYHFMLTGIRDVSLEANELVTNGLVTEVNSTLHVKDFTTKFGSVKLDQKDELSLGEKYKDASGQETAFAADTANDPARIDYHFSMEPETVKGMAEDWLSDMLIASDTSMDFTLYKRAGTTGLWELVGKASLSVPSGSRWAYKSVSWWFPGPDIKTEPPAFTKVKDLATYTEYAIHVDKLGDEEEFKKWSGPVTMTAFVMAGKTRELSQQPAARSGYAADYERWVENSADIQPIGYDVDRTANNYLEMENPFPYQLAPKIRTESEFPNLNVYDTTANITINLDATARVYWMLIPLSGLAGTEKVKNPNPPPDKVEQSVDYTGTLTEDKVSKATSYSPENAIKTKNTAGAGNASNSITMPALANVPIMFNDKARAGIAAADTDDPRLGELRVEGPNENQILGQTPVPWPNVQRGRARTEAGSELLLTTDIGHIDLTGLTPNTVYMLVMLTENESGIRDTDGAYCYRFTTEVASRPYFDLAGSGAIVTAETKGTANMHFFVMQGTQGRFSEIFDNNWAQSGWDSAASGMNSDGYTFTLPAGVASAASMTVLDAMSTKCERVVGSKREYVGSVFDVFATPTAVTTFSDIIRSQTGSSNAYIWSTATRGTPYTISGSGNQFNCETRRGPGDRASCVGTDMNPLFTYTIVAVAESADGTSSQMSFRAWAPLSVSDNEAPAIRDSGCTDYEYDDKGNLTSASFYVDFNEPLYAYYNNVRHPIDYCSMDTYLGKTNHCTDAAGQTTANQWVSVAQLVGKTVSMVSALELTGLEDYKDNSGSPPAGGTTPTYTQYHGTPTDQTVSRVQMISFTIEAGKKVSPGVSMALLGGAGYQIADAVGNGGNNLYIKFTFTRADALNNEPPSFEIEWR